MTGPVTTEALAEARELVRQSLKGGVPGLTEATREAVVGSIMLKITNKVLAPLLAAHQQVTAERDEDRAELARLRAEADALAARPAAPEAQGAWRERAATEIDAIAQQWGTEGDADGRAYAKTLAAILRAERPAPPASSGQG